MHFNEPGPRSDSEGLATGSSALAAGGVTTAVARLSRVDFGLWGGIVPGNVEQMEPLAERGVVAYKAFTSETGVADFAVADDLTLYEGIARVAGLGLHVAVHADAADPRLLDRRRGALPPSGQGLAGGRRRWRRGARHA